MYYITRTKTMPKALKGPFFSYEEARQAIRKWLRSNNFAVDNAPIGTFGFSISRA